MSGCETGCSDVPPKASLFISGSPGTGKTVLINSVLAGFECSHDFKVITVNCMAQDNVDNLWDCLCENIDNSTLVKWNKTVEAKGKRLLDRILASQERRCLIVLDELDHITKSPHALSAIFLFARKHSSIRIIGIANTHTFPVSASLSNDEAANVLTLHFGAIYLAISSSTPPVENPFGASVPPITPNHILAALKTSTKRTSLTAKLRILKLPQLYMYCVSILEHFESGLFASVSHSEFLELVSILETSAIVCLSAPCSTVLSPSKSGRSGVSQTSSFGSPSKGVAFTQKIQLVNSLHVEEVLWGLGVDAAAPANTDPWEEEVRTTWIRESRRTTRDMPTIPPCVQDPDLFEAAFKG
ncbi:hypothetical protein JVT61DRAFT_7867 [Boletus reticuloceps]|uniref:AAA+ ATPase domain-containing protein n=1 Tax=Boletus reticuloceps TaxID=495285 RepID=A0A8I3A6S4_9AGAM|nr:hypothetical protein JVT61DRAFT_7867 [Boletus reticuloceps]